MVLYNYNEAAYHGTRISLLTISLILLTILCIGLIVQFIKLTKNLKEKKHLQDNNGLGLGMKLIVLRANVLTLNIPEHVSHVILFIPNSCYLYNYQYTHFLRPQQIFYY